MVLSYSTQLQKTSKILTLVIPPSNLWMAERFDDPEWLALDIQTAYGKHMYPNGALILNMTAKDIQDTDFSDTQPRLLGNA